MNDIYITCTDRQPIHALACIYVRYSGITFTDRQPIHAVACMHVQYSGITCTDRQPIHAVACMHVRYSGITCTDRPCGITDLRRRRWFLFHARVNVGNGVRRPQSRRGRRSLQKEKERGGTHGTTTTMTMTMKTTTMRMEGGGLQQQHIFSAATSDTSCSTTHFSKLRLTVPHALAHACTCGTVASRALTDRAESSPASLVGPTLARSRELNHVRLH